MKAHSAIASNDAIIASIRKLVLQSCKIYSEYQQMNTDTASDSEALQMVGISTSQAFRKQLRMLNTDLTNIADRIINAASPSAGTEIDFSSTIDQLFDLVLNTEKSWHLCEIFLLNNRQNTSLELCRWLFVTSDALPASEFLQAMAQLPRPEQNSSSDTSYWRFLYGLVFRGDLSNAVKLLMLHSEIDTALVQARLNPHAAASGRSFDATHCHTLFALLDSHPFVSLVCRPLDDLDDEDSNADLMIPTNSAAHFNDWNRQVQLVRNSGSPLLRKVPELDLLLRALEGDFATLSEVGEHSWMSYTTFALLYRYSPPLTRSNVARVVEDAIEFQHQHGGLDSTRYLDTLRELANGNVGPVVKNLYESGKVLHGSTICKDSSSELLKLHGIYSNSLQACSAVVSLLSTTHLSTLLVRAADKWELAAKLQPPSANETSLLEELTLELTQQLNALEFAPTVLHTYLANCPDNGLQFLRTFVLRRPVYSDSDALSTAALLRQCNFAADAQDILLRRGMWWLRRDHESMQQLSLVMASDLLLGTCSDVEITGKDVWDQPRLLAKAVNLFQHAGEKGMHRIHIILDRCLSRCMVCVARCKEFFPGLAVRPPPPAASFNSMDAARIRHAERNSSSDQQMRVDSEEFQSQADNQLHTGHADGVDDRATAIDALLLALQESQEIIDAFELLQDGSAAARTLPLGRYDTQVHRKLASKHARILSSYIVAVRLRLELGDDDLRLMLTKATLLLVNLLTSTTEQAPARLWLHLLELVAWFHQSLLASVLPSQQPDTRDTARKLDASLPYITKQQAYKLLECMEVVCTAHNAKRLCYGATDDQLRVLRVKLLGLLSNRLIKDNAEQGEERRRRLLEQQQQQQQLAAKQRYEKNEGLKTSLIARAALQPHSRESFALQPNTLAYEFLTGSVTW